MNGIGLFSDSIHSISSELFSFSHSPFSSFSLFLLSFVFLSFYSDFTSLGNFKALYSFFKFLMNELNEVPWIYGYFLFPTEVLGNLMRKFLIFFSWSY